MERPFDYIGLHSDTYHPNPHHLVKATSPTFYYSYDALGGHTVTVTGWFAPTYWERKDIEEVVAQRFELQAEYCQHEHDCCGRFYADAGKVIEVIEGVRDEHGDESQLVLIRQSFVQNV